MILLCTVLFQQLPSISMCVVPGLMGSVCVSTVCSGQSKEAGGGHEHRETIP